MMADKTREPAAIEREIAHARRTGAQHRPARPASQPQARRAAGDAKAKVEAGHVASDIRAMVRREPAEPMSSLTGPVGAGLLVTGISRWHVSCCAGAARSRPAPARTGLPSPTRWPGAVSRSARSAPAVSGI